MVNEGHSPPPPPHPPPLRAIFVDTSIGTHLGIVVSIHDTIANVKAKIRAEHALCFKDIGDISIKAIKVRRRGFFYNLADSMYVMNAFDGFRGSWFIFIDAVPIRPLENQEVVMSKVTHEPLEPHNSTVPVCCVDRHEGTVSIELAPKKQDVGMNKLLAQDGNVFIHSIPAVQENQKSLDPYLKELIAEDVPSLQNGRISAAQNSQVVSVDDLIPCDRNIKLSNNMKVNEAHLHEDTAISPGKNSGTDARETHNQIFLSGQHGDRPEPLIDQEDGERKRKKFSRDIGVEFSDGMPSANRSHKKKSGKMTKSSQHVKFLESQSQHHLVEKKRVTKVEDGVLDELYEDHRTGSKFRRSENIYESICNGKRGTLSAASELLPSNLPNEDASSIQESPVEKQNKRRKRKSSKSHEEVRLAMSSETPATGSLEVTTNPCNSGKDANASKYPTEANIYESLPNDDRDTNIAPDASKFLGSASQMETNGHSMEISLPVPSSINKKMIENQVLQINSAVQSDTLPLHHSPVEKQRKKRKSSKFLAMSSETIVVQSSKVTIDQEHSVKEDASISLENYPTEAHIDDSLPNDDRVMSIAPDAAKLIEIANQKEKIKKKKRKSSKFLAMPSETIVVQSSKVAMDQEHSVKEDASISLENYPTEAHIDDSLPNDDRVMCIAPDATKLIEIANQKEKTEHPMEICMVVTSSIIEPTEESIIQLNHVDQSELPGDLGRETDVDICLKEAEVSGISSLVVASQTPVKLYCRTGEFKSESSNVLEPMKSNDQQYMNIDTGKFIPESNLKEDESGSIDARTEAPSTAVKLPYKGQSTHATSKDSSGDKLQDSYKETEAAASLKGPNKDRSRGRRKTPKTEARHRRKKLKTESTMICESTEVNGGIELLNSDDAQIFLNDIQNEPDAAKFIKEADQKANGGHCFDTADKSSSSSKKVPGQVQVSHVKSVIPLISMPPNMSNVSNGFIEQAAEGTVPLQLSTEFQAKPRRSKKKLKCELSNLGSPEITNVVLLKSNDEIKKFTEVSGGSDPSKLANGSNQTVEQYSINSKVTVPLSGKDSSKQDEVPWVISVDPTCSEHQDLNEQSNAKVKTKEGDGTQILLHRALAGPSKSKHDKKKLKNAELKIHDSSEMGEHMELFRPNVGINLFDYSASKADRNCSDVPIKYEIKSKSKSSRKTEINRLYEALPADFVQFAFHKEQMVESQTQGNDISHHSLIAGEQDIATKDSKSGNARNRRQPSRKQKGHDKHKLEMKLQDYGPQLKVQLSKSWEKSEHGRKITADGNVVALSPALNHSIDNIIYKDECVQHKELDSSNKCIIGGDALGSNHCDVSLSGGKAYMAGSSDSTENTPHEIRGYKVVKKVPTSRSQKVSNKSNFEKSLLAKFGRISNSSDTRFDSDSDPCKKKAITTTASIGVPTTTDSGMHLEEMQKKSSALKPQLNTHFSGVEFDERCGESGSEAGDRTKNHSRSGGSRQKMPLSAILRSSNSYNKATLTASQSEFEDTESRPIDVVLETQPESTP